MPHLKEALCWTMICTAAVPAVVVGILFLVALSLINVASEGAEDIW